MNENTLWVDKYRPSSLDDLVLNPSLTDHLKKLVRKNHSFCSDQIIQAGSPNFPHLLFYGPPGAGKKTRITALLKELFGASVEKVSFCA
jgi:replication factor C subunit 3/5